MNNKGQSILSEYAMIFLVVIAGVAALTIFVQRGLEARIHDARNFMIDSVVSSGACDANCIQAAGGNIYYEYEPYYPVTLSDSQHNDRDSTGATKGSPLTIGVIYSKSYDENTNIVANSSQLPPCASGNPVPLWCN